jgi:hypothetical protein
MKTLFGIIIGLALVAAIGIGASKNVLRWEWDSATDVLTGFWNICPDFAKWCISFELHSHGL